MRFIPLLILSCALSSVAMADAIRVGAAVSLKGAMEAIARKFEADTGTRVDFVFGSSGQVMTQIKSGAEMDLFLSAGTRQMDDLEKNKLIDSATRRTIVTNTLVMIVPADAKNPPARIESLSDGSVGKIAVGEPKTVPAGLYTEQVFAKLKLTDAVAGKLVYGTNVRQVLSYVDRGEVSAGIVYATDAKEAGDKVRVMATAEKTTHEPINYPGAVLSATKKRAAAELFLSYLGEAEAKRVFADKGFGLPEPTTTRPATP